MPARDRIEIYRLYNGQYQAVHYTPEAREDGTWQTWAEATEAMKGWLESVDPKTGWPVRFGEGEK